MEDVAFELGALYHCIKIGRWSWEGILNSENSLSKERHLAFVEKRNSKFCICILES